MNTNLHQFVLGHLAVRRIKWTQVSRDTGIPYETLKKIASGRTPNPGVIHVQTLADYFQAQAPASIAQAATETVAVEAAPVNALRAGRVRRLAERRMQRQRTDGDRRARGGSPFQVNVMGEA